MGSCGLALRANDDVLRRALDTEVVGREGVCD